MTDEQKLENALIELYHNLYRMHGYLETILPEKHGVKQRANLLLKNSYERVQVALPSNYWGRLEKPHGNSNQT